MYLENQLYTGFCKLKVTSRVSKLITFSSPCITYNGQPIRLATQSLFKFYWEITKIHTNSIIYCIHSILLAWKCSVEPKTLVIPKNASLSTSFMLLTFLTPSPCSLLVVSPTRASWQRAQGSLNSWTDATTWLQCLTWRCWGPTPTCSRRNDKLYWRSLTLWRLVFLFLEWSVTRLFNCAVYFDFVWMIEINVVVEI